MIPRNHMVHFSEPMRVPERDRETETERQRDRETDTFRPCGLAEGTAPTAPNVAIDRLRCPPNACVCGRERDRPAKRLR